MKKKIIKKLEKTKKNSFMKKKFVEKKSLEKKNNNLSKKKN